MVGFTKEARSAATAAFKINARRRKQEKVQEYLKQPRPCGNMACLGFLNYAQAMDGLRFCCRACSNSVVPRLSSAESKQKVSAALTKEKEPKLLSCMHCQKVFSTLNVRVTCSRECAVMLSGRRAAETMKIRGTCAGWHNRRGEPSYPEKYFMSVFQQEGIVGWKQELKVGRWFIDFAFEDIKLAVEIDGRQHDLPDRIQSDKRKDEYLESLGWKVIRVRWFNPRTEKGKEHLHPQVKSLLTYLKDHLRFA